TFGVLPRTLSGLKGIVFSPFIHSSTTHLYNNTFPVFVLLAALFYFYADISWKIVCYGIVLSGFFTWIFAREAYHIGASGLIYVLASFIFFKGIFTRYYRLIALSLIVVFLYGSLIWYVFPIDDAISWEGHLSGFLTGLLLAIVFKQRLPEPKKYEWEAATFDESNDPFLKHFDAHGNFIPESELLQQQQAEEETDPPS
ncbi:MAG: rhomboid family intramembrane serine protease, partial [Bacteroidota bacterium]